MQLYVKGIESSHADEVYLSAVPSHSPDIENQAHRAFEGIRNCLIDRKAWICQERIFAPANAIDRIRRIRAEVYGDLDDGVEPNWLGVSDAVGSMPGVQVYAVRADAKPQRLAVGGKLRGRAFEIDGCRWIVGSGLSSPNSAEPQREARIAFEQADGLLRQAGTDMHAVARTWIFMDKILTWYGPFNQTRTDFFIERGLLGPNAGESMPASTGIGVSPAGGRKVAMDLYAVVGPRDSVNRFHAAGKQRSAFEYGSAFSRGAAVRSPAGRTVFVSGTAAIDMAGATCCVGDIEGQIQMTLENVVAVLRQLDSSASEVVQAMAYCASPAVEEAFRGCWQSTLPWPWLIMQGDVCRDDLLFEVEALALRK